MIRGASNDKRLTDTNSIATTSFVLLVIAASDGVATLLSWLIYECSNTIEQCVIPGGSNDERLTDVDKRYCYVTVTYAK